MKNITFTSGTVQKISDDMFELNLFNGEDKVYSANLDLNDFMKVTTKHRNIQIIK